MSLLGRGIILHRYLGMWGKVKQDNCYLAKIINFLAANDNNSPLAIKVRKHNPHYAISRKTCIGGFLAQLSRLNVLIF